MWHGDSVSEPDYYYYYYNYVGDNEIILITTIKHESNNLDKYEYEDFNCVVVVYIVVTAYDSESGRPGSNPEWGLIYYEAYPSLHPSGVVHWVPEQLNIKAVTGMQVDWWLQPCTRGRHFNFFLGAKIFFIFQCHRTIEKLEKPLYM